MEAESGLIVSITLCTHMEAIGPHYTGRVLVRVVGVSITFFLLYREYRIIIGFFNTANCHCMAILRGICQGILPTYTRH